jgi:hypothetical protein
MVKGYVFANGIWAVDADRMSRWQQEDGHRII